MILKIKSAQRQDGWFIFDNAEEVVYSRHPGVVAFFHDTMGNDAETNVIAIDEESGVKQGSFFLQRDEGSSKSVPRDGWFLTFLLKGEQGFELWGDTEVYLLNDNGKTIERIF